MKKKLKWLPHTMSFSSILTAWVSAWHWTHMRSYHAELFFHDIEPHAFISYIRWTFLSWHWTTCVHIIYTLNFSFVTLNHMRSYHIYAELFFHEIISYTLNFSFMRLNHMRSYHIYAEHFFHDIEPHAFIYHIRWTFLSSFSCLQFINIYYFIQEQSIRECCCVS